MTFCDATGRHQLVQDLQAEAHVAETLMLALLTCVIEGLWMDKFGLVLSQVLGRHGLKEQHRMLTNLYCKSRKSSTTV